VTPTPDAEAPTHPQLLVVTGMSGAGRSTAAHVLEDLGWYVVDNLPPQLISTLAELTAGAIPAVARIAVVVDVRVRSFFAHLQAAVHALDARGTATKVLFLDASDEALVRRFESVRRPHPLQGSGRILDGIVAEREALALLRSTVDTVVDTSHLNVHQLSATITELFGDEGMPAIRLSLVSFGFKYGIPLDADQVADVRFLPNPFWQPDLRALTGLDDEVSRYVLTRPGAEDFLDRYLAVLEPVLEGYQRENKRYATVAVGCTGGKHRSVAMVEELERRLQRPGLAVSALHRDLGRE
jgi:UPF0042 nucleotide-binding protein